MPVGRVPDEGPLSARIAIVGEAPGQDEMYYKRPFVGASGKLQDQWIAAAGLRRRDLYITNVLDTRPSGNGNIENADDEDIWSSVTELHKRLDRLPNLQVIAAVGTYASYALTGHGKVKWLSTKEKRAVPGITSCRGYYYQYTTLSGRCVTVIPMLHPASLMRSNMLMEVACISDWKRVAQCLRDPWPVPNRTHIIDPTEAEVASFTEMVEKWREDLVLATDVETWGNQLNCVGFSHHPEWSITVPLEYAKQRETFFPYIRRLLISSSIKALQNGVFDGFWFKRSPSIDVFIPDHNWLYDTLFMHHSLFPYEPHSLEYLVSRYVPAQYWKDETKGQGIKQYIASLDTKEAQMRLHLYNGKDCCMTRALVDPLVALLHRYGMYDFYVRHYAEMFAPMLSASTIGVRVDRALMENRQKELLEECQVIREACDDLTGVSLFANKDFSPVKLADFFYRQHKCSKIFSRKASGKSSISLDGTALRRLSMKYPGVVEDVAKLVLRYRQHAKQASFLNPELVDSDDRMRCTYTLNTTAGRAASSGNPMDTGLNLQNQQKDIRNIYLPDRDDWYMLKVDLSTAENRIVDAYIALGLKELGREEECQFYIDRANRKPWEWDQHRARAAALFGVDESQVTKIMRNDGKMVVHACQRDMQAQTLSDRFLKHGVVKDEKECAELIDAYHRSDPYIKGVYFKWIQQQLIHKRLLVNPFGRRLDFGTMRMTNDTFRKGYSFPPQSSIADHENTRVWRPTYLYCKQNFGELVRLQVHDEIVVTCSKDVLWPIARFIVTQCDIPIRIGDWDIVVPGEVTVSRTWQGGVEFKKFPNTPDEFYAEIDKL